MDAEFERHFAALVTYIEQFRHCNVPTYHFTPDGIKLGQWLGNQRQAVKKPDYPSERRERLETLGVRLTVKAAKPSTAPEHRRRAPPETSFSHNLAQLAAFVNAHGTCDVPHDHELFPWSHEQILAAEQGTLPPDHLQQLVDVGLITPPDQTPRQAMRG